MFTSSAICIMVFTLTMAKQDTISSANTNQQFQTFLQHNLVGCTVRIIHDPIYADESNLLQQLSTMFGVCTTGCTTFITNWFNKSSNFIRDLRHELYTGLEYDLHKPASPSPPQKRYSTCYSHLYLIRNELDLRTAISYHFVDFDLKQESPRLIIFWDASSAPIPWKLHFWRQEFYASFMDYRLYIRQDPITKTFNVQLICIICVSLHSSNSRKKYFYDIPSPPSPSNIHKLWYTVHQNHYGEHVQCMACDIKYKSNFRSMVLVRVLKAMFNITYVQTYTSRVYNKYYGFVVLSASENEGQVGSILLNMMSPRYHATSYGYGSKYYQMFSVAPTKLLTHKGWLTMITPFSANLWLCFVGFMVFVLIVIHQMHNQQFLQLVMVVIAPLMDHSYDMNLRFCVQVVGTLWSFLCLSHTMIYGGDLATSLSVLKPPYFPSTFSEIGHFNGRIVSVTALGTYKFSQSSSFGLRIQSVMDMIKLHGNKNSEMTSYQQSWLQLIREIKTKVMNDFCESYQLTLNTSKNPFSCLNKPSNYVGHSTVTFINIVEDSLAIYKAYEHNTKYWVSPVSQLPDYQETSFLLVQHNYFGKLIQPLLAAWWSSGFGSFRTKELELDTAEMQLGSSTVRTTLRSKQLQSFTEFEPMKWNHLTRIDNLFYVILAICIGVLVVEWFSFYPRVLSVSETLLKLAYIFSSRRTIRTYLASFVSFWTEQYNLIRTVHWFSCRRCTLTAKYGSRHATKQKSENEST